MRKLLTNQKITSEGGWHVVRLANQTEEYYFSGSDPEYQKIKQWCRQCCTGTYGYSRVSGQSGDRGRTMSVSYFVFKEGLDVTAVKLLNFDIQTSPVWPSGLTFTMFVGDKY